MCRRSLNNCIARCRDFLNQVRSWEADARLKQQVDPAKIATTQMVNIVDRRQGSRFERIVDVVADSLIIETDQSAKSA